MSGINEKKIFHYGCLTIELHPEVYEPAEDTFLLADTIDVHPGMNILELGSGCGLIALNCALQGAHVVCTDINPFAVKLIQQNYKRNKHLFLGTFDIRYSDLFSHIAQHEQFDYIVFNPPYLPTKAGEKIDSWLNVAVDGGPDGLKIITRFLKDVPKYLTFHGKIYFVFSSLASEQKLFKILQKNHLEYSCIKQHRFEGETLSVYCAFPTH
ncbi:MAG: methyltransferase [Candidatus Thermoplasmatota archaeon]